MSKGAPFTADWLGTSPLHLTAQHGRYQTTEVLLRAGCSRDARTKVDKTPLHIAAYEGHADICELLLKSGADVDARDILLMTPLHWAVERGHVQCLEVLLKHGANVDAQSKFDKTPADISDDNGRPDLRCMLESYETYQPRGISNHTGLRIDREDTSVSSLPATSTLPSGPAATTGLAASSLPGAPGLITSTTQGPGPTTSITSKTEPIQHEEIFVNKRPLASLTVNLDPVQIALSSAGEITTQDLETQNLINSLPDIDTASSNLSQQTDTMRLFEAHGIKILPEEEITQTLSLTEAGKLVLSSLPSPTAGLGLPQATLNLPPPTPSSLNNLPIPTSTVNLPTPTTEPVGELCPPQEEMTTSAATTTTTSYAGTTTTSYTIKATTTTSQEAEESQEEELIIVNPKICPPEPITIERPTRSPLNTISISGAGNKSGGITRINNQLSLSNSGKSASLVSLARSSSSSSSLVNPSSNTASITSSGIRKDSSISTSALMAKINGTSNIKLSKVMKLSEKESSPVTVAASLEKPRIIKLTGPQFAALKSANISKVSSGNTLSVSSSNASTRISTSSPRISTSSTPHLTSIPMKRSAAPETITIQSRKAQRLEEVRDGLVAGRQLKELKSKLATELREIERLKLLLQDHEAKAEHLQNQIKAFSNPSS